ncbi:Homeodomain-like DNA binding domain-containing transcription factor [Phycomyces blakesleeanus NRRL 1555(-)]|uniref:Homeodomain-like DNA binding domain-containing transcription factor n=1 Tax=Phycomyces blakesleeanus (strain ATCC 8743b / DSM 1359 / FGSC 10004 / NBRC 33097 / NRRL 1555) TaxID=763407 RepID=A0A162TIV3_PHYB8|nr:Homeodomain-like DNA binding domain-containing transcription factor [Phycomyces blakesleeanus NRRL 1555(-)]OAD68942.1 Homeodomain-like DNA binding domain-containing transcription factor [Phycomyces blakesleeanus NRRL 1555(-)]|eukprot:XP_018286982.1 Homeodomain-like DNA binding domain-containing transcription factor [Phycomyces blakesleeanus NRRL 1555(-)]
MQDANSSENTHGSYEKADPYKYGCIMYMHLANYGATQISLVVGMSLSTVKYIIKRVDETGSPEPRKGSGRPRKIDERTERHLVQIVLERNDGGARAIRKVGERFKEENIIEGTKWGKGSVMIWSCFWAGGFGPLVFLDGNVNQDQYVNTLAQNFLGSKIFRGNKPGASCSKRTTPAVILGRTRGGGKIAMRSEVLTTGPLKARISTPSSISGGLSRGA